MLYSNIVITAFRELRKWASFATIGYEIKEHDVTRHQV